jgi:hypothetical protein
VLAAGTWSVTQGTFRHAGGLYPLLAEHLAQVGRALVEGFAAECSRTGVAAELRGPPARTSLSFAPSGRLTPIGLQSLFVQECLKRGVLTNGNFLPSYAHDEAAVDPTRAAFARAIEAVARACETDRFEGLLDVPPLSIFFGEERRVAREVEGTC